MAGSRERNLDVCGIVIVILEEMKGEVWKPATTMHRMVKDESIERRFVICITQQYLDEVINQSWGGS